MEYSNIMVKDENAITELALIIPVFIKLALRVIMTDQCRLELISIPCGKIL